MSGNLKPCPFCGSNEVVKISLEGWGVSKYRRSRIICKKCGLKTRYFEEAFSNESVADYWNNRIKNE